MTPKTLIAAPLALCLAACSEKTPPGEEVSRVGVEDYGNLPDGRAVKLFTLINEHGMTARVTEYGAILVGLEVPDQEGTVTDVTQGFDTLEGWLGNPSYFGATVGRFGNRIAHGRFTLDGVDYQLATNNDPGGIPCHLHGGETGFSRVLWHGEPLEGGDGVVLTHVSEDGEDGYPGTLTTTVTYRLTDDNQLVWKAEATVTDKATPVNLAHHSYWNLSNEPGSTVNDHLLTLFADEFLPTDAGLIPTGERAPVAGTPFDFTRPTAIGSRLDQPDRALEYGGGYDHCWVLRPPAAEGELRHAATLHDPVSGRSMEIHTDQPGIQFYGGNFLDGTVVGKGGVAYPHRSACCLETEGFPDAPNQPDFPSTILRPGETYSHTMVHRFRW